MRGSRQIISLLLLLISQLLFGQSKNAIPYKRCPVKTINFEQGLLNNASTNIFTDQLGFTWVSTKTGLQRFNGYVLETITPVVGKDTFRINYPVFFYGMHDGCIWITCREGILQYDPATNAFEHIFDLNSRDLLSSSPIFPLKETEAGVWCIQEGRGVVIYNRKGTALQQVSILDYELTDRLLNYPFILYRNFTASNDDYIFILDKVDRIECINVRNKEVRTFHFNGSNILGLAATQENLYIISDQQLLMVNINDGSIKKTIRLKDILNDNLFTSSVWVENGKQILVSLHGHLYEFDTSCNMQHELTDLGKNLIAPSGHINRLYTDKFGRIWVLTNNDIKRIENTQTPFAHFIYPDEKNNFVRSLYYDEDKHFILAGCLGGGIQLYDTLSNPLWKKPLITLDVKDVTGIEKLTNDDYLVITFRRGWFLLNLPTRQIHPFDIPAMKDWHLDPRAINFGNSIQRIDKTTVALSTANNIFLCIFSGSKMISIKPIIPFTEKLTTVNCFLYASDQTWWAGSSTGLVYRFDRNNVLQTFQVPEHYDVRSITEDAEHNIWVGTDKGLCLYSSAGIFKKRLTRESGLLNDCIYGLLPVDKGAAVFASSNWGLSFVSAEGRINNYSKELGLQENEFNTGSVLKTASGRFYFGGVNGITAFYPAALNIVSDTPIINVTRLVVNDSLYNSSAGSWMGDSILLKYYQNRIQLDLLAMGLLNSNEYIYKYRLKGFEYVWQSTRQPLGIKYILGPGEYTFEITCRPVLSNQDGPVKRIVIIIYGPWWKTWWFYILMFILAVSVVAFIVQQYNRRLYMRKIRALQLQQEIQGERERISRDLHDSLGTYAASIASNIEHVKILKEDDSSTTALQELRSNSQSIVSQLGDTIWALKKDALSLTAISDRLKVFLQKVQLSYPGIAINISEQIKIDPVLPASQAFHLLQIVQEAVINAVRHSHCNAIQLFVVGDEHWTVSIEDNGNGMPANASVIDQGNGLTNMMLRAKESGWKIEWQQVATGGTKVVISPTTPN